MTKITQDKMNLVEIVIQQENPRVLLSHLIDNIVESSVPGGDPIIDRIKSITKKKFLDTISTHYKDGVRVIYTEEFDEEELADLAIFYESNAYKKTLKLYKKFDKSSLKAIASILTKENQKAVVKEILGNNYDEDTFNDISNAE